MLGAEFAADSCMPPFSVARMPASLRRRPDAALAGRTFPPRWDHQQTARRGVGEVA